MKLILASQSPRRRELLATLGYELVICPAQGEEDMSQDLPPEKLVEVLATQKAKEIQQIYPEDVVLGADSVVVQEGTQGCRVFGKPRDNAQAVEFLSGFCGKPHIVYTGVCITQGNKTVTFHDKTVIHFRDLTHEEVVAYVEMGESLDKAGAYGIQGLGALMVSGIEGDYHNVMGLPLSAVVAHLSQFGLTRTAIFQRKKEG